MNYRLYLIKLYYLVQNKKTLNHLKYLENTQYLSSEEIEKIQLKKLKKLISYAYKNVPFYKKQLNSLNLRPEDIKSLEDLTKLPILTKKNINSNLSKMKSVKYANNDFNKNSTGGSSGYTLNFYNDNKKIEFRQAFVLRGNIWAGLNIGMKHVNLWGSPFDESLNNKFSNSIKNNILGSEFLSSYELSNSKIKDYMDRMVKYGPKVLIAYPSALYEFSKYIDKNNINPPHLESIITSAETLYDFQRILIENVFKCKIFNRYGCREFGSIAHECSEHQGLHINSEHLIIEFLGNKDYENTNGDENSKLIITDLDNYAMPFIRYEIGDLGKLWDHSCNCGRNLPLMDIKGRTFDVIIGTNGKIIDGHFFSILLRTFVKGIEKFQVIQKSKNDLNIKITTNNEFKSNNIYKLKNKIAEYCGNDMKVNFDIVTKIKPNKSGKHRFIISEIGNKP